MDIYSLSRSFWDFSFENPEKMKPIHSSIFFFAIEHCNRLWWKDKFWFPTTMVMDAIWISNYSSYKNWLDELVEWGFIKMIQVSKNQYSANVISLIQFVWSTDKALDKALIKHGTKQHIKQVESIASIDIQVYNSTNVPITNIQDISKDIWEQALVVETHWVEHINLMQWYLRQAVWLTAFKDSKERWYVTHCYNLMKKIWRDEFNFRLQTILSDQFKAKNCNKLAYLYWELKSFIHSPVIKTKEKESVMDIVL